ncbi:hypothetical protein DFH29DRAFT_1084258 [Suillus ampliporus]|nr:hypothetical protein DFH29DRAFT_1084258 [Suillus ampliporus]
MYRYQSDSIGKELRDLHNTSGVYRATDVGPGQHLVLGSSILSATISILDRGNATLLNPWASSVLTVSFPSQVFGVPVLEFLLSAIIHSKMGQFLSSANNIADEVEKSRVALQRCPLHHSRRSACLHNLAIALHDRFEQRSVSSDLDEAIDLHRAALQLRPIGHSHRSASLDSLANCLRDKFHQRGSVSDLDDAVALHRAVLLIRLPGHPDRSTSLNNLAIDLHDRFNERGAQSDLDGAIELH